MSKEDRKIPHSILALHTNFRARNCALEPRYLNRKNTGETAIEMESNADKVLREMAVGEKKVGSSQGPLTDDDMKLVAEELARSTTLTALS